MHAKTFHQSARRFVITLALFIASGSFTLLFGQQNARRALLVISVDGLDYRYLRDCDKLKLRIPNMRRMMREGEVTEGIIGVFPTVTWPSHTTLVTGVTPAEHGILGNRRPKSEGGDYYWDASLLKAKTLWQAAHDAGLKTAAVTWPVTVTRQIDYNLPEYFQKRNGGAMDLPSIETKATPGLVDKITASYPSFPQEWMDDRTRMLATIYLLEHAHPDLLLLHLVDHDAQAHETGPFAREANAVVELTDEYIGRILRAVPSNMVVALVSDHGFERADKVVNINVLLRRENIGGEVNSAFGLLTTKDAGAAAYLRRAAREHPEYGIGREIPNEELAQYAPRLKDALAAFEPAEHYLFGPATEGELFTAPQEKGVHGLWPNRADYRSSLVLWGAGVRARHLPPATMLTIAPRFARILGINASNPLSK